MLSRGLVMTSLPAIDLLHVSSYRIYEEIVLQYKRTAQVFFLYLDNKKSIFIMTFVFDIS